MNPFFSLSRKIALFSVLALSISTSIHPTTPPEISQDEVPEVSQEQLQEFQKMIQDQLEFMLKDIISHLNGIDTVLEDLAMIVSNSEQRDSDNRTRIVEQIRTLRESIAMLKGDAFVHVDLAYLNILLHINAVFIEHINEAIDAGFNEISPIDTKLEAIITRSAGLEPDLEDMAQLLTANKANLEKLKEKSKSAGLRWYNKFYRLIDNYIVQPTFKYKVPTRIGQMLLLGTGYGYLWWHSDSDLHPWLRKKVGYGPKLDHFGKLDLRYHYGEDAFGNKIPSTEERTIKEHPTETWASTTEQWMADYAHGRLPVAQYILTPLLLLAYKDEIIDGVKWSKDKIIDAINYLRGGAYANKRAKPAEKFDPKVNFDDLVGLRHQKEVLSLVVKYIEDPERFDRAKLTPQKGYLLTGPTRTGKSFTAEALAGEVKRVLKAQGRNPKEFGFYTINASLIIQKGISYIIELAKKESPCVLFIDEIDLLGLQRAGGNRELLSEFLITMSGCLESDPDKQVIILAATNKSENLDHALKQRGRFGVEIRFEYPCFEDRKEFFERKLSKLSVSLHTLDIDKLVRETENRSYEDLNVIIQGAFTEAKNIGQALNQELLEYALDTNVRSIIMQEGKQLPEKERHLIATHQAGNALACILLNTAQKLAKVTVLPIQTDLKEESVWDHYYFERNEHKKQKQITYGKMFTYHEGDTLNMSTEEEKHDLCKIYLAGYAAERLLLGSCGYSYYPDNKQQALEIVKSLVFKGINVDALPDQLKTAKYEQTFALLDELEQEVFELLKNNRNKLEALVDALLEEKILDGEQVEAVIWPEKVKKAEKVSARQMNKEFGIPEIPAAPVAA